MLKIRGIAALIGLLFLSASCWFGTRRDYDSLYQSGMAAVKNADWEKAAFLADQLLQVESHQPHGALIKGYCLLSDGDPAAALLAFSRANADAATKEQSYYEAGIIYLQQGQYLEGIALLQQVVDWNPDALDAHRRLAAAYYDIGTMESALNSLQEVIRLDADDCRPHYMKASILYDYEQFEKSVSAFEQASLRLQPDDLLFDEIRLGWGECLLRLRRYEAVLTVTSAASSRPEIQLLKASALFHLRRYADAETLIDNTIRLLPNSTDAKMLKAQLLELKGEFEKSMALLETASTVEPNNIALLHRLGDVSGAIGKSDQAQRYRQRAGELAALQDEFTSLHREAIDDLKNAQLRLKLARLSEQLDKPQMAAVWYRAAVGIDPGNIEIQRAWQEFKAHRALPESQTKPATGL